MNAKFEAECIRDMVFNLEFVPKPIGIGKGTGSLSTSKNISTKKLASTIVPSHSKEQTLKFVLSIYEDLHIAKILKDLLIPTGDVILKKFHFHLRRLRT